MSHGSNGGRPEGNSVGHSGDVVNTGGNGVNIFSAAFITGLYIGVNRDIVSI